MRKIYFVDKNKELCDKVKNMLEQNDKLNIDVEVFNDDVFEIKNKYPEARICTASNPLFSAGAGLDAQLKNKYPEEWAEAREFKCTQNLFFGISVDDHIESNCEVIKRLFVGIYGYCSDKPIILTGVGTSIGGLNVDEFINLFYYLRDANLRGADLSDADLRNANLRNADLSYANLSGVDLRDADLRNANLRNADLSYANLSGADLCGADLWGANLSHANLSNVNLSGADLSGADLSDANLRDADLSDANLCGADLWGANLCGADLSGAQNMLSQSEWMNGIFESNKNGFVVYKSIGNTNYEPLKEWKIQKDSYLTEVCNPNRQDVCGCGVNFGTKEFCQENYPNSELWECLIEWKDLVGVVVPYNTDGKARCERLKLIKKVK